MGRGMPVAEGVVDAGRLGSEIGHRLGKERAREGVGRGLPFAEAVSNVGRMESLTSPRDRWGRRLWRSVSSRWGLGMD